MITSFTMMLWNSGPVSNTQSDYSLFNLQHSIFLFNDLLFFLVFIEHVYATFFWFDSDARERQNIVMFKKKSLVFIQWSRE